MLGDLRPLAVAGQQDVRERLVVAQENVAARLQPLDQVDLEEERLDLGVGLDDLQRRRLGDHAPRSEEHTSELQSLMRISYAVFCLKQQNGFVRKPDRPRNPPNLAQLPYPSLPA